MPTAFFHKKSLGQNFLVSPRVLALGVEAGAIAPGDVLLEIGPGQGALTRLLLASPCRRLHAIEIDERLAPWLEPLEREHGERFNLIWSDALAADLARLSPPPGKVLANIPYSVTSRLIWKLLAELAPRGTRLLVLLVQKEAADRLRARPGSRDRGPLGVALELMGRVEPLTRVPPGAFSPPPKVRSELIRVEIERNAGLAADADWRALLAASFARRRKKLLGNLTAAGRTREEASAALARAGVGENARAEELAAPQWLALKDALFGAPGGRSPSAARPA